MINHAAAVQSSAKRRALDSLRCDPSDPPLLQTPFPERTDPGRLEARKAKRKTVELDRLDSVQEVTNPIERLVEDGFCTIRLPDELARHFRTSDSKVLEWLRHAPHRYRFRVDATGGEPTVSPENMQSFGVEEARIVRDVGAFFAEQLRAGLGDMELEPPSSKWMLMKMVRGSGSDYTARPIARWLHMDVSPEHRTGKRIDIIFAFPWETEGSTVV